MVWVESDAMYVCFISYCLYAALKIPFGLTISPVSIQSHRYASVHTTHPNECHFMKKLGDLSSRKDYLLIIILQEAPENAAAHSIKTCLNFLFVNEAEDSPFFRSTFLTRS